MQCLDVTYAFVSNVELLYLYLSLLSFHRHTSLIAVDPRFRVSHDASFTFSNLHACMSRLAVRQICAAPVSSRNFW